MIKFRIVRQDNGLHSVLECTANKWCLLTKYHGIKANELSLVEAVEFIQTYCREWNLPDYKFVYRTYPSLGGHNKFRIVSDDNEYVVREKLNCVNKGLTFLQPIKKCSSPAQAMAALEEYCKTCDIAFFQVKFNTNDVVDKESL